MILKNCGLVLNASDSLSTFLRETRAATGRFFLVKTNVSSSADYLGHLVRVFPLRLTRTIFSGFISRLDSLIQRLQHTRIHGGNNIHRRIELLFRHTRFPCVRKAALHSRIAKPHHRHREPDEHLFSFSKASDGMSLAIKCLEISFLQDLTPSRLASISG
jgi:hypothetical protein